MATSLPEYLTDQTYDVILQRMLGNLPDTIDKSEGSFAYDMQSPPAIQLAQAAIWAQQVLARGFAQTTFGSYLDLRAGEHGLTRRAAVAATGTVTFTGTQGTDVPSGTQVSTASTQGTAAVVFQTTVDATVGSGGTVDVAVEAVDAGSAGNVGASTITFLAQPITGITGVTNAAATSGGLDEETDAELLDRYLTKVQNPSAGGNKADYVNWALAVQGVGGVSVIPVDNGPGTVGVYVIDTDKVPASDAIIDSVRSYIAPPQTLLKEDSDLVQTGYGTSTDTTQPDSNDGSSVKMIYNASGNGVATLQRIDQFLPQPGIWTVRPNLKVDSQAGANDLVTVEVYNLSTSSVAKTTNGGSTDASLTLKASDLATAFGDTSGDLSGISFGTTVHFWWNGTDQLEVRITRLTSDTTTTLWEDNVVFVSTFTKDTGDGKAPIGAQVSVLSATAVIVNVSATLTLESGYDATSVEATAKDNIATYLRSIAFADDNDVFYNQVGDAILNTDGVKDYSSLTVNGGSSNITVADDAVAVLGTVTWS